MVFHNFLPFLHFIKIIFTNTPKPFSVIHLHKFVNEGYPLSPSALLSSICSVNITVFYCIRMLNGNLKQEITEIKMWENSVNIQFVSIKPIFRCQESLLICALKLIFNKVISTAVRICHLKSLQNHNDYWERLAYWCRHVMAVKIKKITDKWRHHKILRFW